MSRNKLKVFLSSILCLLTLSCTFLTKQTGEIKIALPEVSRSYTARNNVPDTDLDFQVKLITVNGNVFYNGNYKYNDKSSNVITISDIPVGKYELSLFVDCGSYVLKGDEDVFVKAGAATKVELELEREEKPVSPDPEVPSEKVKDLTVNITGNDSATKLTYSVTPGDIKDVSITGNSFTVNNLNVGTEYTVTVEGSSDTHTYSGSGKKTISATGNNEINIDVGKTVRKFEVTGTLTGVSKETGNNVKVSATNKETNVSYAATVTENSSYKFSGENQLPAGIYEISVSGGNNTHTFSGGKTDVVINAANKVIGDINVESTPINKIGSITGKVTLPEYKEGLTLTASAYNAKTKSAKIGEGGKVNTSTGEFTITGLPFGTYRIEVAGESKKANYKGSTTSNIGVNTAENIIDVGVISVTETLKNGGFKINCSSKLSDTATLSVTVTNSSNFTNVYENKAVKKSSFPIIKSDIAPGDYTISVTGSDEQYEYALASGSPFTVDPGVNDKEVSITLKQTQITKNLTINLSGNEGAKDLKYSVTPGDIKDVSITGNSFTVNNLNAGTEYTITVTGSSDTHTYSGSGKKTISATENNEINIDVGKTVRKFDVTGTLTDVTNEIGNTVNVSAKNMETATSYTATVTENKSYKFSGKNQLPAGTYEISVSGGNNTHTFSGNSKNVVINASQTTISQIRVTSTSKETKPVYYNANGVKKEFDTVTAALNQAKSDTVDNNKIYVTKNVKETDCIEFNKIISIEGVGNPTITIDIPENKKPSAEPSWLTLKGQGASVIQGVNITTTTTNAVTWSIQVQNGSLELGTKAVIGNKSNRNSAILLKNQGTVILNMPANIDSSSNVQVYDGGKIKAKTGFENEPGTISVNLNKEPDDVPNGVWYANCQILTCDQSSNIKKVAEKVIVTKGNWIINSEGKLAAKPNSIAVKNLQDFNNAITNAAAGSTILVKNTTTMAIGIGSTVSINKNITIKADGDFQFLRSMNFADSLINVAEGATLTMEGFTIIGGSNLNASAPIISCKGNLILNNCTLKDNNNTSGSGAKGPAAIYFGQKGTQFELNNCIITNNKGNNNSGKGAITIDNYNSNMNIKIINGEISSNIADNGAIYINGKDKAKVNVAIEGTKILNNEAKSNGGGLNISQAVATIKNITMTGNTAGTHGGGIAMSVADVTITGSTIKDNVKGTTNGQGNNICVVSKNNSSLKINGTAENINKDNQPFDSPILPN